MNKLASLRTLMKNAKLDGYFIPHNDAHNVHFTNYRVSILLNAMSVWHLFLDSLDLVVLGSFWKIQPIFGLTLGIISRLKNNYLKAGK
jgi:hypothetical protein